MSYKKVKKDWGPETEFPHDYFEGKHLPLTNLPTNLDITCFLTVKIRKALM